MKHLTKQLFYILLIFILSAYTLSGCGDTKKQYEPQKTEDIKATELISSPETAVPITTGATTTCHSSDTPVTTIPETTILTTDAPTTTKFESTSTTETPNTTATPPPAIPEPAETSNSQQDDNFSEYPTKKIFSNWKEAYLYTIEYMKTEHVSYALVNIDDDIIPELYMMGSCEAAGEGVYSFKNGIVYEVRLGRTGGGKYIENNGTVYNNNGNMGYYYTEIYTLGAKGFTKIFLAIQQEEVTQTDNETVKISYTYSIDNKEITEEEYINLRNSFFNLEQSTSLYQKSVDYNTIKNQIYNYNS